MKICIKCNESKESEAFPFQRNTCISCRNKLSIAWRKAHPGYIPPVIQKDSEYHRRWNYSTRYGITLEQFEMLLAAQNSRCGICCTDKPTGRRGRFVVDHCHKTGKIRGILCDACNKGIGILGDTKEALLKALNYLENKNIVDFQKENRKNKGKSK